MMRQPIFKEGEAEKEYVPFVEWERQEEIEIGGAAAARPEYTQADESLVRFADGLVDAIGTVVQGVAEASLSLDVGVEVQASRPDGLDPLVLIPRIDWWGGEGRGASYRSSADASRRGHLGDKRMDSIDRYSCLGTDQGGSLSGICVCSISLFVRCMPHWPPSSV